MAKNKVVNLITNSVIIDYIKNTWWVLMLSAILLILIGLYALVFPGATIQLFGILFGMILVFAGAFGFVRSLMNKNRATSVGIAVGVIAFIIGIYVLLYPAIFVELLVFIFALILLIKSIISLQITINAKKTSRWLVASGIIGILAAIFLFISPMFGSLAILIILGIYAILLGIMSIIDLINIRRKFSKIIKK